MKTRGIGKMIGVGMLAALLGTGAQGTAGEVRLADRGAARCVIVVPSHTMAWEGDSKPLDNWSPHREEPERRRRLLRDSVADLALYLGKMSGAKIEVVEGLPAGERRLPVYVGAEAQKVFGPVGKSKARLFGFRVVASNKGIGLYGESEYGTSYAIYELLHRLGCRWYMPSDLGECIPSPATLTVPDCDDSLAPATEWRRMENRTADPDFRRRNRMGGSADGGTVLSANQGAIGVSAEQLKAHPAWRMVIDGRPTDLVRWTRSDVADAIAEGILKRLEKDYEPSVSLSPGDYVVPTEDSEERRCDPEPRVWEPAANQWSVSDRLVLLVNRIAERVNKKYPEVRFGVLVYVNYSMPPVKTKVNPNVVPVISPIDFNRHHPMTWPNHPNDHWLLGMVQGWGKAAGGLGYYAYGMNLGELSAPCPFITKWGTDIPIVMQSKCDYWMPETQNGWESMMPGFYLSMRLTFNPKEKPEEILAEMWTHFYGPAVEPMGRYWNRMDRAWIDANEHSGCLFGYLQMFTPEVLKGARADVDEALRRCANQTSLEYRRVKLVDESLSAFERFMKMRWDWAAGRMGALAADYDAWTVAIRSMQTRYSKQYVIGGLTLAYGDSYVGAAYKGASRLVRETQPLATPLLRWQYHYDKQKKAEALGWTSPEFDDTDWKTTHVVMETWSTIGHHNTMGRMAYRTSVSLAAVPAGKRAFLWIGSTDGSATLFVNGRHVKYVVPEKTRANQKGDVIDAFSGFCQPAMFDVTGAVKPGANQITILCERNWLNELGTGGLMGPVVVCREK